MSKRKKNYAWLKYSDAWDKPDSYFTREAEQMREWDAKHPPTPEPAIQAGHDTVCFIGGIWTPMTRGELFITSAGWFTVGDKYKTYLTCYPVNEPDKVYNIPYKLWDQCAVRSNGYLVFVRHKPKGL